MLTFTNGTDLRNHATPKLYKKKVLVEAVQINEPFMIETVVNGERESLMQGDAGDWVLIGVQNEVWRVEQAIFEATYGPADGNHKYAALVALNTELNTQLEKVKADLRYMEETLGLQLDRLQDIFQKHEIGLPGDHLLDTAADIIEKFLD